MEEPKTTRCRGLVFNGSPIVGEFKSLLRYPHKASRVLEELFCLT